MNVDELVSELEDRLVSTEGPDYLTLRQSDNAIATIGSTILGILLTAIVILFPIVIVFEIAYIIFPIFQQASNKLLVTLETKGADKRIIGLAFRDAKRAIKEANVNGVGSGSALFEYLKIKVKSIIFIAFVLSMELQGSGVIINVVWNLVSNLINMIFKTAS